MKRSNLTMFLSIIFAVLVTVSACKKEEDEDTATPATLATATITGTAKAQMDTTAVLENVPAGTKIFARISTRDLVVNDDTTAAYADRIFQTTVAGDGTYSLTVDANVDNVTVTVVPESFRAPRTYYDVAMDSVITEPQYIYDASEEEVTLFVNQTKYLNLVWD